MFLCEIRITTSIFRFTSVGIVSYKRLRFLLKEVGLALVSRNSATITFTSSPL